MKLDIRSIINTFKTDYENNKFEIQKETDIICYLYLLLKKKYPHLEVLTGFKTNKKMNSRRGLFDLVLVKDWGGKYEDNTIDVALEVKWDHRKVETLKSQTEKDIKKLIANKNNVKEKVIFIVNPKNKNFEKSEFDGFIKSLENKGIVVHWFYSRGI